MKLQLSFDIGHSSIGWAVLTSEQEPSLLGCGSVIFPADDCLASTRRGFRRQRRHIRATRLRIARLGRLFVHLGHLTQEQVAAPGCAWPWLLAARVLRGGAKLTWAELWDALRWYAHNRGYDGNKAWSRQDTVVNEEDTEKELKAHELLDAFAKKHARKGTMAEVFCDRLGLDPLGTVKASPIRFRDLGAAFPREGVEAEVERILQAQGVEPAMREAIMRDHTQLKGPDYRLPLRYAQLVNGKRTPGGLLFGQLIPRFDNRIISTCPIMFQRVYSVVFDETGDAEKAKHEAEKMAKVPGIGCVEFYRFRWAMQLANVMIGNGREPRRLTADERQSLNKEIETLGAFTPGEFKKAVRALTNTTKDNLDRLLALPDADKSLVLDPAKKAVRSGVLGVLWPHLSETLQKHTLTDLRRGKAVTVSELLEQCPAANSAVEHWFDSQELKASKRGKKYDYTRPPRLRDLDERHSLPPTNGRAAYSREVMREVHRFVLATDGHPMDDGAPLFRTEKIRHAQLQRAIDEQTNNHLVRHRLRLLERLHADILKEYAGGEKSRIARITVEVNRNVKELSGKTAQEQAKTQGQQLANFKSVERKLAAAFEGKGVKVTAGMIRKARVLDDLDRQCPYTGHIFEFNDLLERGRISLDHVIPHSDRNTQAMDSLVATFTAVNEMKGKRTAMEFIEEFGGKTVTGMPNMMIRSMGEYTKFVDGLRPLRDPRKDSYYKEKRIPIDDDLRKWLRKGKLKLPHYVEKEFTPGDLTRTSQLVRLAAEALQREYLKMDGAPVITSLPGSVTGTVRKSWNLIGCMAQANSNILNPDDLDEDGRPRVHRKTEIRGITHLHHALDACVLGFISHFLPRDGGAWKKETLELLSKRRCNAHEQAILRATLKHHIGFTPEGQPILQELSKALRDQLCARLAERRVVQHLPASMADMVSDQTVWRVYDPQDRHENARRLGRWLAEKGIEIPAADAKTVIIICRKRKAAAVAGAPEAAAGGKVFHEGNTWRWVYDVKAKDALLGYAPTGDPAAWKLKPYKAVKVLGDNFGIALDPEPTLIRPLHVWRQVQELRAKNGGKWPRVVRIGMLIRVLKAKSEKVNYSGVWMVRGVTLNQRAGYLLDLSPADQITYRGKEGCFQNVSLKTLIACGLEVVPSTLCGVASDHSKLIGLWKGKIGFQQGWDEPVEDFREYLE